MQQFRPHSVTLILGGVRSGKSRYAQRLAARRNRVTFIATAESRDDNEMRLKIERHRTERPQAWPTIEEPLHLAAAISNAAQSCDAILVDCLTIFAANLLEAFARDGISPETEIHAICELLQSPPCHIILVSNEVGSGVVPAYPSGRQFRDLVGELNQRIAAVADTVLLIVAGLPLALKGSIPPEVLP